MPIVVVGAVEEVGVTFGTFKFAHLVNSRQSTQLACSLGPLSNTDVSIESCLFDLHYCLGSLHLAWMRAASTVTSFHFHLSFQDQLIHLFFISEHCHTDPLHLLLIEETRIHQRSSYVFSDFSSCCLATYWLLIYLPFHSFHWAVNHWEIVFQPEHLTVCKYFPLKGLMLAHGVETLSSCYFAENCSLEACLEQM